MACGLFALGLLAVVLAFPLCLVAARVTGETDATPIGQLGQVAQLLFGIFMPRQVVANLMAARERER